MWMSFCKKHKFLLVFLLFLLAITVFLRFYNLRDTLMFQGDQGRDALVVSEIFRHNDPVFIGPVTSIGNMYLGPFYYYFMLPFLLLTYPDPMGPVYAVALLSVITVFLLFYTAVRVFSKSTALWASLFFALSASVVALARFSWNPNIAPFFSVIMFLASYLAWYRNPRYWLVVALCFSFLVQLHYVTLLSGVAAAIIFLAQFAKQQKQRPALIRQLILSILIVIFSFSPLFLFDLKHDGLNTKSFVSIVTEKESFDLHRKKDRVGLNSVYKLVTVDLKEKASKVLFEPSFGVSSLNHPFLFVTVLLLAIYLFKRGKRQNVAEMMLLVYLGVGILGISLYQHEVYEHYIGYLFPLTYLFYGLMLSKIRFRPLMLLIGGIFLIYFVSMNAKRYSLASHSWTIDDMNRVAEQIHQRVDDGEKYNIVLLAESKDLYGMNYRYFLSTKNNPPVALADHHSAEKLFVINEEQKEQDIANLDIYEIVVFPDKIVEEKFNVGNGIEVTVLSTKEGL